MSSAAKKGAKHQMKKTERSDITPEFVEEPVSAGPKRRSPTVRRQSDQRHKKFRDRKSTEHTVQEHKKIYDKLMFGYTLQGEAMNSLQVVTLPRTSSSSSIHTRRWFYDPVPVLQICKITG